MCERSGLVWSHFTRGHDPYHLKAVRRTGMSREPPDLTGSRAHASA